MTLPEANSVQLQYIQESPKFAVESEGMVKTVPFPGYTIITPPWQDDGGNDEFYQDAIACQEKLIAQLEPNLLVPLPPKSLHFTLADLIWDSAYLDAAQNPDFETKLRGCIGNIFKQCEMFLMGETPIRWQLLGLIVMTRAVAICLAPKDEQSYDRILGLRRAIYQNADLIGLGIEQQYHFTAHVTLGYFGKIPENLDRTRTLEAISELNQQWIDTSCEIRVHRAELRRFEDMTDYHRESDWPMLEL